ncbi:MAG: hypothetical protein U7126_30205 [Microcoleus sp.]
MTQAKERLLTDTHSQNDCIVLDLEEFDLSDLDALKNTALGNVLEKNFSKSNGFICIIPDILAILLIGAV